MTLDTDRPLFPAPLQGLSLSSNVRPPSPQERMAELRRYVGVEFANVMLADKINKEPK